MENKNLLVFTTDGRKSSIDISFIPLQHIPPAWKPPSMQQRESRLHRAIREFETNKARWLLSVCLDTEPGMEKLAFAKSFVRAWARSQSIEVRPLGAWCNGGEHE